MEQDNKTNSSLFPTTTSGIISTWEGRFRNFPTRTSQLSLHFLQKAVGMPSPAPEVESGQASQPTSRLDNAGTLLQSISSSIVPEKVTIVHPPFQPFPDFLDSSLTCEISCLGMRLISRRVRFVFGRRIIPLATHCGGSS